MKRLKALNGVQKFWLLLLALISIVFSILYPITISKVGFLYNDVILEARQEGESTIYTGQIYGKEAKFTVEDKESVVFEYGESVYGPYSVMLDPSALPEDTVSDFMFGVEVRKEDIILFRGGAQNSNKFFVLVNEDGTTFSIGGIRPVGHSGSVFYDENGNVIDPMEPTIVEIIELAIEPSLVHKGEWWTFFLGLVVCIVTAHSILFAEELFRFNLSFQIQNTERAEPSEWEIISRYFTWTVFSICAIVLYIIGLK